MSLALLTGLYFLEFPMISRRPNLNGRDNAQTQPAITRALIAVPIPGSRAAQAIDAGSGIVLLPFEADATQAMAYYEGNRFGATNLQQWTERVHMAFSRASARYPTVARSMLALSELTIVGEFENNRFYIEKPEAAAAWLRVAPEAFSQQIAAWDKEQADKQAAKEFRENPARFMRNAARMR